MEKYRQARRILVATPQWDISQSDKENVVSIAEDMESVLSWSSSEEVIQALVVCLTFLLIQSDV
jgi:hypothetical protein